MAGNLVSSVPTSNRPVGGEELLSTVDVLPRRDAAGIAKQGEPDVKLYSYFRSSAAYRVRIALNLKNLSYDMAPIHLVKDGGRHRSPEYRKVNPQMRLPALALSSGEVLIQSLAIIEYLDEVYSDPPAAAGRGHGARLRACGRADRRLRHPSSQQFQHPRLSARPARATIRRRSKPGTRHWVTAGFDAVEDLIHPRPLRVWRARHYR